MNFLRSKLPVKVFVASLLSCFATASIADEPDLTVTAKAELVKVGATTYRAEIDLGMLPQGESVAVVFSLENPFDQAIEFEKSTVNCSCVGFDSSRKTIPPKETTVFKLRLQTSSGNLSPIVKSAITLSKDRAGRELGCNTGISIIYTAENFLKFDNSISELHLNKSEELKSLLLPITFTKPIDRANLELTFDDSLRDLAFEIKQDKGKTYVEVIAPKTALEGGAIGGEIRIKDKLSGSVSNSFLSVNLEQDITISPRVLRFARNKDNPRILESNVMIRLNLEKQEEKKKNEDLGFTLRGTINTELSSKLKIKKIAGNIYRVKIAFELPESAKEGKGEFPENFPVNWTLAYKGSLSTVSSSGVFLEN